MEPKSLTNRDRTVEPRSVERALDLDELVRGRRSVRRFRPDPVPGELIEQLIAAAGWAPSPHGTQPWRFVILTGQAIKQRLADAMSDAWVHNLAMDGEAPEVIEKRLAGSRRRLLEAPALILICLYLDDLDRYPDAERQASETTMAIQSLGAAAQNILLTAYRLGLDGGWMCAPLFCPETVRETLELSSSLIPHALLTIGYAAADPKRRPRRPLSKLIVAWE